MVMSLRNARAWLIVLGAATGLALTASCSRDVRDETGSSSVGPVTPARADGLRVRPAVDLQSVMSHAALAFRLEGGRLAAAGATFEARITRAALEVTPRTLARQGGVPLTLETSVVSRGSLVLADAAIPPSTTLERDGSVTVRRGDITEKIESDEGGVEQSWRFEHAPAGAGDLVVRVHANGQSYTKSTDQGLHFGAQGSVGFRYGTATWVDEAGKRTVVVPRFVGTDIVMAVPHEVLATSSYPAVLDPSLTPEREIDQPIGGSSASGDQFNPTIVAAGKGKGFLAVWYDRRGLRPALYGARIASDGTVLDGTGIPIATGVGSTQPFVSASDTGYLVTWSVAYVDLYQGPGIYGVRLDAQGQALDTTPLTLVANQTNLQQPTSAFDGASWLVAWQRYSGGSAGFQIAGLRVPRTGAVLDAAPLVISAAPEPQYQPLVTFDGNNQLVTWRSYSAIYGRKFGKDGKPVTDRLLLANAPGFSLYNFSVAFDGNQHLLVWSDYVNGNHIFARRIAISGAPIDLGNLTVSTGPQNDDRPRAAWDGISYVITYSRGGQLAAQRMSAGGGLIDVAGTIVNSTGNYYDYALASDGIGTIAVSRTFGTGLAGADVSGVVIGRPPIPNATAFTVSKAANSETEPSSAWDGASHFIVWLDTRDGRPAIYGASVGVNGQPAPATKVVSDPRFPNDLTRPRIASDGSGGYLVVFYAYDQLTGRRGIRGLRIDAAGSPDATGVFDIYVPALPSNEYAQEPDVAFDGTNFLIVWQDQANDGTSQTSIAGVRLPKTGTTVVDKEPIRVTTANPVDARTVPSVAFDGQSYFVAWITSRATATGGIQVSHVYGSRVSKQGAVLDGEQAVCNAFLLQRAPFVAGDTKNGGFMVVWEDYRTALESADVYGARISAQGQNLDGASGMKIAVGPHDESRPRVAGSGDGTNWVVAWRDLRSKTNYDLYASWISVAGKNHDPEGLVVSAEPGDEDSPWLSASKDGKLIVSYQRLDPRTGYGSYRVRARAIDSGAMVAAACSKNDDCASRSCVDRVCCYTECGACGQCNITPGTCTPRAANSESPTCPAYRCKGTLECPSKCDSDTDCASNATCDPSTKKCVSRVICIDDQTLKDLTGKQTSCAPYRCTADACRTQCGSVDDCAGGFVCDYGGRCVQATGGSDGGCAVSSSPSSGGALLAGALWMVGALVTRRRRPSA